MSRAARAAFVGVAALIVASPFAWRWSVQPPPPREEYLTVVSDRDEQTIQRLAMQGKDDQAVGVLLEAIRLGPSEPKIGAACRREFLVGTLILECIRKVMKRREYEEETERMNRAYQASR